MISSMRGTLPRGAAGTGADGRRGRQHVAALASKKCMGAVLFFLAQRVFIEGITLTGVKG